jgi:signal transduction histidine kinase/CheY-like chemotaxis protein
VSPELVDILAPGDQPWPIGEVARAGEPQQIDDAAGLLAGMTVGPYPEIPKMVFALPITQPGREKPAAVMVAGVSSRLMMNEQYRGFYDLVAAGVSTALANARACEEERQKSEALTELARAKIAFFSNVSHEFRTPLTLMLGPTEDALSSPGRSLSGEPLQMVHRNTLRLMKLVNALLDFSRIESGRTQASYQPSDLAAMTTHLASAFRSAVERAGLAFEVECESLPEPIYVDHDMWEKIVLNLLSNALKFTFEGSIGVAVRWRGDHAELEVRDTGTGIPESELPHLFERFHQVHGARSRTHEGSGIGLALVHDLVQLHGGTVQVASRPSEGTTFTVSIPRGSAHLPHEHIVAKRSTAWKAKGATPFVEEALRWSGGSTLDAAGPSAATPTPNTVMARVRILVVDDNADLRDYIVNLLREHYAVETAADGLAALEVARLRKPTLVLSDVMMPRLDGFGLLRALRADPALRDVPVILLSARAGEESTIEGLEAGADDYLVKPFAARELLARVRTHVEASLMREQLNRQGDGKRSSVGDRARSAHARHGWIRIPRSTPRLSGDALHAGARLDRQGSQHPRASAALQVGAGDRALGPRRHSCAARRPAPVSSRGQQIGRDDVIRLAIFPGAIVEAELPVSLRRIRETVRGREISPGGAPKRRAVGVVSRGRPNDRPRRSSAGR